MLKLHLLLVALAFCHAAVFADEWVSVSARDAQYNCDVIRAMLADHGEREYVRLAGDAYTLAEYHALTVPECFTDAEAITPRQAPSMKITVTSAVNLRRCAAISCELVGQAQPGDIFELIGADGDWYEIRRPDGKAYIAAWLALPYVDAPEALLADFQFTAIGVAGDPNALKYGTTAATGHDWLTLRRADGSSSVIHLQALKWADAESAAWGEQPKFFGWGQHEWEALPRLLAGMSFYIYLPAADEMHEFPVAQASFSSDYTLGFDMTARPAGAALGRPMRILVAAEGQADYIKDWIASAGRPRLVTPPGKPAPPSVTKEAGQHSFAIEPPEPGAAPIANYELRYREAGSGGSWSYITNVDAPTYTTAELGTALDYEFSVAAINSGGRGAWSNTVSARPGSPARTLARG